MSSARCIRNDCCAPVVLTVCATSEVDFSKLYNYDIFIYIYIYYLYFPGSDPDFNTIILLIKSTPETNGGRWRSLKCCEDFVETVRNVFVLRNGATRTRTKVFLKNGNWSSWSRIQHQKWAGWVPHMRVHILNFVFFKNKCKYLAALKFWSESKTDCSVRASHLGRPRLP